MNNDVMLEVRGLEINYGHIEAVRGIDFTLNAGDITALVGANGAGKSTTLLALSGLLPKPRLLLLDEPSMGLAPIVVQEIFRSLRAINATGLTLFLVEQNVRQALKIAQRGYVLENGAMALSGTGKELLGHPRVLQAYLGG